MDTIAYYQLDPVGEEPKGKIWSVWEKKFIQEGDKTYEDWKAYKVVFDSDGTLHPTSYEEMDQKASGGKGLLSKERYPSSAPDAAGNATPESLLSALKFYNLPYPLSLEELKDKKLQEINAICDSRLKQLTSTYPEHEQDTFYKQESEALDLLNDPSVPTPCLNAIATFRGIPVDVLAQKVRQKAALFAVVSGEIIGSRQKLEDLLERTSSEDEINMLDEKIEKFKKGEPF